MDSLKLFRLVYLTAMKNNINLIPVPKQPFTQVNQQQFIKDVEIFLMHPEMFKDYNQNSNNKYVEPVNILYGINYKDLTNININLNDSKKYFNT
jgi:hypothetical protein